MKTQKEFMKLLKPVLLYTMFAFTSINLYSQVTETEYLDNLPSSGLY